MIPQGGIGRACDLGVMESQMESWSQNWNEGLCITFLQNM